MPNWVKNRVSVYGEPERIKEFMSYRMDFDKIIPRPKDLDIECSTRSKQAFKYIENFMNGNFLAMEGILSKIPDEEQDAFMKLGVQAYENNKKYGYTDWYGWSIDNWGTKWYVTKGDIYVASNSESSVYYEFDTAWSMPRGIMNKLFQMFPDLKFNWLYADEDLGVNCGEIIKEANEDPCEFDQGFDFACEVWNCNPDEIKAEWTAMSES